MADVKCPGQDTRYWKKGDIFDVRCPKCGRAVEFFKDDVRRRCACGRTIVNPKLDLACAEWCRHAEKCVGALPEELRSKKSPGGAPGKRSGK
jgi:ribosomal protein S27E